MLTDRELIEQRLASEGLAAESWVEDDDGLTAKIAGRWVVASDEYEDRGLYYEDEGVLSAGVVGSEEYHNRGVSFSFLVDGEDEGRDVPELTALDAIT